MPLPALKIAGRRLTYTLLGPMLLLSPVVPVTAYVHNSAKTGVVPAKTREVDSSL